MSSVGFSQSNTIKISYTLTNDHFTIFVKGNYDITIENHKFYFNDDFIVLPKEILSDGFHFIYYTLKDNQCVLTHSAVAWYIAIDKAPVCFFYWNRSVLNPLINIGYECHTTAMTCEEHRRLHFTKGTQYKSGFELELKENSQISLTNGIILDEDLVFEIGNDSNLNNDFAQLLSPIAELPIYYRFGFFGFWKKFKANSSPLLNIFGDGVNFNKKTNNVWSIESAKEHQFVIYHIFATNILYEPVVSVVGQAVFDSLEEAKKENLDEDSKINLFSLEFKEIYKIIAQTTSANTAKPHGIIKDIIDLRTS